MKHLFHKVFLLGVATLAGDMHAADTNLASRPFGASGNPRPVPDLIARAQASWSVVVPAPRITGVVRDPSGKPAAGVGITFYPGSYLGTSAYPDTKTDANGRYELILQIESLTQFFGPDNPTNSIMARDFSRNLVGFREFTGTPTNIDLKLQPGITLSGSVKDTQGVLLTNATVDLKFQSGIWLATLKDQPVRVNAEGLFSISALPQGREYYAWDVTAKGYGSARGHVDAKNTRTSRYEFPAFILKPANRRLEGRVVGHHGKPLAGANVSFSGQGQPQNVNTNARENGNFAFDAVCDGPVQIYASYSDPNDSDVFMSLNGGGGMEAHAGDTNILIRLRDTSISASDWPVSITTGTVFDPSGKPADGVSLAVWRSENPMRSYSSAADGQFRVRWKRGDEPADRKSILVARDLVHDFAGTHYLAEGVTKLDLHLQPGCAVAGSVRDEDGKPLTNAIVTLDLSIEDAAVELDKTSVDTNATFFFKTLPLKGDYFVRVSVPDHYGAPDLRTNFAKAGQQIRLPPFILTLPIYQVTGTAVNSLGKPVSGVRVMMTGQQQIPITECHTDAEGRFVFNKVAKGPVVLSGMVNTIPVDDGYACNPYVYAQGGDTNVILRLVVPATHSVMEAWQSGDKSYVIAHFPNVDWNTRPLFDPYRKLSLTEDQFVALSDAEREACSEDLGKEVERFRRLLAFVMKAGRDAAAKRDEAKACKIFSSLRQCGTALDSPDCLRLLQIVGKHLKKEAESEVHKLGCSQIR